MRIGFKDRILFFIAKLFNINPSYLRRFNALNYFIKHRNSEYKNPFYTIKTENPNGSYLTIKLRSNSSDIDVYEQVLLNKEYSLLIELVKKYNKDHEIKVVFDLGANIGLFTLYLSAFFTINKVIAVEPEENNFEMLLMNTGSLSFIVIPVKAPIWKDNSTLEKFSIRDRRDWSVSYQNKNITKPRDKNLTGLTIRQLIIDYMVNEIDILKIDIEGAEKILIESENEFSEILKMTKFIALEIHDEIISRIKVTDFFIENNFILYSKGDILFGVNQKFVE